QPRLSGQPGMAFARDSARPADRQAVRGPPALPAGAVGDRREGVSLPHSRFLPGPLYSLTPAIGPNGRVPGCVSSTWHSRSGQAGPVDEAVSGALARVRSLEDDAGD